MLNNLKLFVCDNISYITVCYIALVLLFVAAIYVLKPAGILIYIEHVSNILKFHIVLGILCQVNMYLVKIIILYISLRHIL